MNIGTIWLMAHLLPTVLLSATEASRGKWVFIAALVALLVWLIVMPRQLVGQVEARPAWWRNVRVWAIVICVIQIWIYWQFA